MRATWIIMLMVGIVPGITFYLLRWLGVTDSARFVATTTWTAGSPSPGNLFGMAATLLTWIWLKGFMVIFFVAAIPFIVVDVLTRRRKTTV